MWALIWNAWRSGYTSKIVKSMDFLWATDTKTRYKENKTISMYHNAGVTSNGKLFYKGAYTTKSPFFDNIVVDNKYCSAFYVDEINSTKENYPNLIKIL